MPKAKPNVTVPPQVGSFLKRSSEARTWGPFVACLSFSLLTFGSFFDIQFILNRVILAFLAILALTRGKWRWDALPPEIKLYLAFLAWSLTGLFFADNYELYWIYFTKTYEVMFVVFIILTLVRYYGNLKLMLLVFVFASSFVFSDLVIHGEAALSLATLSESTRWEGFSGNPNALGFFAFVGTLGLLMLLDKKPNILILLITAAGSLFLLFVMLGTASRKTFLTTIIFFALFALFVSHKKKALNFALIAVVVAGLPVLMGVYNFVMKNTYLGARMEKYSDVSGVEDFETEVRYILYMDGLDVVLHYPIAGVGLGNFIVHNRFGVYAHSDPLEVITTTGIVGFILYYSIYAMVILRLLRVYKITENKQHIYQIRLILVFMLSYFFIHLGRPGFMQLDSMLVIGTMSGYSLFLADHYEAAAAALRHQQVLKHYAREQDLIPALQTPLQKAHRG